MSRLDGKDGNPGFCKRRLRKVAAGKRGFLGSRQTVAAVARGSFISVAQGGDLLLQLHLHPSGKMETEQSRIGFYFTSEPPTRSLNAMMMIADIYIPAGEKEYRTHVEQTINYDSTLVASFRTCT
jgi:hypothetical protein